MAAVPYNRCTSSEEDEFVGASVCLCVCAFCGVRPCLPSEWGVGSSAHANTSTHTCSARDRKEGFCMASHCSRDERWSGGLSHLWFLTVPKAVSMLCESRLLGNHDCESCVQRLHNFSPNIFHLRLVDCRKPRSGAQIVPVRMRGSDDVRTGSHACGSVSLVRNAQSFRHGTEGEKWGCICCVFHPLWRGGRLVKPGVWGWCGLALH